MRPPFPRSRLASTLGTILGTALASPALADIDAIAGSQNFDLTSVATWRGTDFNITQGTAELKVHQIDPSVGVVTSATFKFSTHITDSITATATHAAGASWNAGFFTDPALFPPLSPQAAQPPGQLLTNANCTTTTQASCTANQSGDYRFDTTLVAPPANLNAFVGQATTIGALSLFTPIIPVFQPGTAFSKADLTTTAQGKVEVDYTYLKHASPSFAARAPVIDESITFGTHSAQGKFQFFRDGKLFNVGGENTVGLDFDGIAGASGDTTVLRLQIPDFQGLLLAPMRTSSQ